MACLESIVPLIASPIFNFVYITFRNSFLGASFLLEVFIKFFAIILFWYGSNSIIIISFFCTLFSKFLRFFFLCWQYFIPPSIQRRSDVETIVPRTTCSTHPPIKFARINPYLKKMSLLLIINRCQLGSSTNQSKYVSLYFFTYNIDDELMRVCVILHSWVFVIF